VSGGRARWTVVNEGNVHIRAEQGELVGFGADGARMFAHPLSDRYFLAGVSRGVDTVIPPELCQRLASVEASLLADKLVLKRRLDVDARACR
jgi:hypothetical protein